MTARINPQISSVIRTRIDDEGLDNEARSRPGWLCPPGPRNAAAGEAEVLLKVWRRRELSQYVRDSFCRSGRKSTLLPTPSGSRDGAPRSLSDREDRAGRDLVAGVARE